MTAHGRGLIGVEQVVGVVTAITSMALAAPALATNSPARIKAETLISLSLGSR